MILSFTALNLNSCQIPKAISLSLLGMSGEPLREVGGGVVVALSELFFSLASVSLYLCMAFPDTFILHLLRQNQESTLTHFTQDLKSGQNKMQLQPGSCQAEVGIVASEGWL